MVLEFIAWRNTENRMHKCFAGGFHLAVNMIGYPYVGAQSMKLRVNRGAMQLPSTFIPNKSVYAAGTVNTSVKQDITEIENLITD